MKLKSYGFTHKGLIRDNNEDSILLNEEFSLFAVADGVGGVRYGEIASSLAIDSINKYVQKNIVVSENKTNNDAGTLPAAGKLLVDAVTEAHYTILSETNTKKELQGMMTTVAAIHLDKGTAHIAHIGDSRIYTLRKKKLRQLTRDHTLFNYQQDNGTLNEKEIKKQTPKNAIIHALGVDDELFVEYRKKTVYKDDIYLITSDGLTNMVSDDEIKEILISQDDLKKKTHKLFEMAMEKGGKDNISIVLIQI